MAVKVKPVALWRKEIENKPGAVANVLENLRNMDLQVVMAYRYPGNPERGAVEAYPITGKKSRPGRTSRRVERFDDSGFVG